ncbi:MAG: class I SAM-dependent methyltransferase [Chloroflexota bacterium]
MFLNRERSGNTSDFWEENWAQRQVAAAVAACQTKPERPLLDRLLPRAGLVLDGGCGLGAWVLYYRQRGRRMIGLDFAPRALAAVRSFDPSAPVCAGSIAHIPLADESLDAYLSGGVVEHAEDGPLSAMQEAHRVLKPGGLLLISVPDFNPLRRLLYLRPATVLMDNGKPAVAFVRTWEHRPEPPPCAGMQFFQYVYGRAEVTRLLSQAGFVVEASHGYGFRSALIEVPSLRRSMERLEGTQFDALVDMYDSGDRGTAMRGWGAGEHGWRGLIWRLFVLEDDGSPLLRLPLSLLRTAAANMRLYVCRRP